MDTIVSTRAGQVRGRTSDGVSAFLGVSYAAPPVGVGRLRPPRTVEPWTGVRDADVVAVASRTRESASRLAAIAEEIGVGTDVTAHDDVRALVRDDRVDAVWVLTPNDSRLEVIRAIVEEVRGGAALTGIAIDWSTVCPALGPSLFLLRIDSPPNSPPPPTPSDRVSSSVGAK